MQPEQLVENMSESLYLRLREAVETGRWPDGQPLTDTQRNDSMTLVMLYQARKLDQTEPFSIGRDGTWQQKSKAQMRRDIQQQEAQQTTPDRDQHTITRFPLSPSSESPQS